VPYVSINPSSNTIVLGGIPIAVFSVIITVQVSNLSASLPSTLSSAIAITADLTETIQSFFPILNQLEFTGTNPVVTTKNVVFTFNFQESQDLVPFLQSDDSLFIITLEITVSLSD